MPMPEVARAILDLPFNTRWKIVQSVPLNFPLHHPQGLVKRGDDFYLTSVEVVDKGAKIGRGWLTRFDSQGRRVASSELAPLGKQFHPGGLDDDGQHLFTPVAEYRPNSSATVLKIDPESLQAVPVLKVADHLGAVVHDTERETLVGANWNAENLTVWKVPGGEQQDQVAKTAGALNLQDAKYLGDGWMAATGLRDGHGGIELYNLKTMQREHQVRVDSKSEGGQLMTRNPEFLEVHQGKLRLYCAPDDNKGKLYTLEPE